MPTDIQIKKKFVRDALTEHGELLLDTFESDIMKLKLLYSEDLLNSLDYDVFSQGEMDGLMTVKFSLHGRFQDMGAGREAKIESTDTNGDLVKGGRKAKRWYTRNVFGTLNNLIYTLLYGLTDEVKQAIVSNLSEKQYLGINK